MHQTISTEIAIFGGGIAGLWLLNRLKQTGFSSLLFESHALGAGQTICSQGIIHGGMKYALTGKLSSDAVAMSNMPSRWQACLRGEGELDLSQVPILSNRQYLWSPSAFKASLVRLFANRTLMGQVESLSRDRYPKIFQHPDFRGQVFALNEMVIDVPALIHALAKEQKNDIFHGRILREQDLVSDERGHLIKAIMTTGEELLTVEAKHYVFVAGSGNEMMMYKLKRPSLLMQRRPLHMVLVKLPFEAPLYAHCIGLGTRPRITITTHKRSDGTHVWYLGGLLAEEGIKRTKKEQQNAALMELNHLFPWMNFEGACFSSFLIDRAEPLQKSGLKPTTSYAAKINNMIVAWPTKLALAPQLADEVITMLDAKPDVLVNPSACQWPKPTIATPVWEEAF